MRTPRSEAWARAARPAVVVAPSAIRVNRFRSIAPFSDIELMYAFSASKMTTGFGCDAAEASLMRGFYTTNVFQSPAVGRRDEPTGCGSGREAVRGSGGSRSHAFESHASGVRVSERRDSRGVVARAVADI